MTVKAPILSNAAFYALQWVVEDPRALNPVYIGTNSTFCAAPAQSPNLNKLPVVLFGSQPLTESVIQALVFRYMRVWSVTDPLENELYGLQGSLISSNPSFGELTIIANATSTPLPTQNAFVQITAGWIADKHSNVTLNANSMTVQVAGTYETLCALSWKPDTGNHTYQFQIFKNGGAIGGHLIESEKTGTQEVTGTIVGIDTFNVNDVIDVRVRCTDVNSQAVTVTNANFNIFSLVGGATPHGVYGYNIQYWYLTDQTNGRYELLRGEGTTLTIALNNLIAAITAHNALP